MNWFATLLATCLVTASAQASVTFNYESLPLNNEDAFPPDGEWSSLKVTIEISDDGAELLGWRFEQANVGSLAGTGYSTDLKWLSFSTDSTGAVAKWSIAAVNTVGDQQLIFATYHDEDFGVPSPGFQRDAAQKYIWGAHEQRALFGIDASGSWTSTATLPNLTFVQQVPEPSAAPMFGAGLIFLAGLTAARRQRR